MGRNTKESPARLAKKLLKIRNTLKLSQNEMRRYLELSEKYQQGSISGYELGTRIPPLIVLLQYAEVAGVYVDVLIDDRLDLPSKLPCNPKSIGIKRRNIK